MDKKRGQLILQIFLLVCLVGIGIYFLLFNKKEVIACSDSTEINSCSIVKPYFCEQEKLIEKASTCGCPLNSTVSGESCISNYQTNATEISLDYILRGKKGTINYTVYQGVYDYFSKLSSLINLNDNPSLQDFRLKRLNQEVQLEFLYPLILKIENITLVKQDQLRIATSLVQNIPFGNSQRAIQIGKEKMNYQRYAYEVLYEKEGVCSEKSELLVFLLRGLGYDTSFIYYPLENHEVVGVKCPEKNAIKNTSYCFIETTGPSIITDDKTEYVGNEKLNSIPGVIEISQGLSLDKYSYEFRDAKVLISIRETMKKLGKINFIQHIQFKRIKKEYGLPEFTNYQF